MDEASDPPHSKFGSLECLAILPLQPKTIGSGSDKLTFVEHQTAWSLDFSPDGTHLAVCYGAPNPCIRVWKMEQDRWFLLDTLQGMQTRTIRCVAFAPLQRPLTLAAASFDGTVAIWEQQDDGQWDCAAQLEGHENECKCVAWNSTGTLLATCGRDKTVWIWESFLTGTIGGRGPGESVDFECLAVLSGHEGDVKCVQFAPSHDQWGDGEEIAISGSYDHTIRIWAEDAGDWFCAATLDSVHSSTVWALAVAPSGRRFISASADQSLAIYRCFTGNENAQDNSSSGSNAVPPKKKGKPAWQCVGKLPGAHSLEIYYVHYAPARAGHGRVVSAGSDSMINIYREALGCSSDAPLFSIDATACTNGGDINCVKWHPDGNWIASAEDSGSVRIWKYNA